MPKQAKSESPLDPKTQEARKEDTKSMKKHQKASIGMETGREGCKGCKGHNSSELLRMLRDLM